MSADGERTAFRTCPLCEATCGLEIKLDGERIVSIRGDEQDVFSHGFICPKGSALRSLHEDPDRVRTPLIRDGERLREAAWDEAFELIDARLSPILAADRNAVALYLGNPNAHNLSNLLYLKVFGRALGSRNVYSASTLDQFPKQMSSALMFGTGTSVPIPDVDRTQHLLMLGANPLASNGSLMTAPDMRGRLRALRGRGGKLVVIDPRRTRTAREADEHHFIRPGTDALLLFSLVGVLFAEDLVAPGERLADWHRGCGGGARAGRAVHAAGRGPGVRDRGRRDPPHGPRAGRRPHCGRVRADRHLHPGVRDAGQLAGGCAQRADRQPRPAGRSHVPARGRRSFQRGRRARTRRGARFGRWQSRVRGLDEVFGELPAVCLSEEIETPGEGQVRALITISGNPVVSNPNSARLQKAISELDFLVSLDVYVNETTRHADVILPAPSPLHRGHYDLALYQFAVRNVANYSGPALPPDDELPDEWVTLLRLTGLVSGLGPDSDVAAIDETVARAMVGREPGQRELPGGLAGR